MQRIQLKHPYDPTQIIKEPIVLILGYFDGVHIGHQAVIAKGVATARQKGIKAALMTFNHPPRMVYQPLEDGQLTLLTPPHLKYEKMAELGIDILYEVEFTADFGHQTPQEFVDRYIVDWHSVVVVAGYDYTYGKKEIATMEHLAYYAQDRFEIMTVPKQVINGKDVSSTLIRQYLLEGRPEDANEALGYPYKTSGTIVHGKNRGSKQLGYPTANILSDPYTLIPEVGVYVVRMKVKGIWYEGMASIGYNVTFGPNHSQTVEVHLFHFKDEIYGEEVEVEWLHYIRPEQKFASIDQLIHQLECDEIFSKKWLKNKMN
ncbi:riboflavin biosynthesis protein RibF [Allofustis seminis]|uniref:riboflavin biosynthesis protein RibF n=1 Tax=Allofustis seminis TaxID=166939 RepID=UPI00037AD75E|nr:riboflavin biosynthesis protein RibF [Allofustis seminis]